MSTIKMNIDSLYDFRRKSLSIINGRGDLANSIRKSLAEKGEAEASAQLSAISANFIAQSSIRGSTVVISAYDATVPDKHIAYVEFGTGIIGKSSPYEGKLPFYWQYDYNEHGENGWYYIKQHDTGDMKKGRKYKTLGQFPKHPMWNVREYMSYNLNSICQASALRYLITMIGG
jgi:hypothetical protein